MNDVNMTRFISLIFDMRDLYESPYFSQIRVLGFCKSSCLFGNPNTLFGKNKVKNKVKLFSGCFIL